MRKLRWILESESGQSVVDFTSFNKAFAYACKFASTNYRLHRENQATKDIQFDMYPQLSKEVKRYLDFVQGKLTA